MRITSFAFSLRLLFLRGIGQIHVKYKIMKYPWVKETQICSKKGHLFLLEKEGVNKKWCE